MNTPTLDTLNQWKVSLSDDQRDLFSKVISQSGGEQNFLENLKQMTNAQNAIQGFTYYSETFPFAEQNKDLILKTLLIECQEEGITAEESLKSWDCLDHVDNPLIALAIGQNHPDYDTVLNALAWFALESCAVSLSYFIECNSQN